MENREFVFILTTSCNAREKAAGALQLATNMTAFDAKIDFFDERGSVPGEKKICRIDPVPKSLLTGRKPHEEPGGGL